MFWTAWNQLYQHWFWQLHNLLVSQRWWTLHRICSILLEGSINCCLQQWLLLAYAAGNIHKEPKNFVNQLNYEYQQNYFHSPHLVKPSRQSSCFVAIGTDHHDAVHQVVNSVDNLPHGAGLLPLVSRRERFWVSVVKKRLVLVCYKLVLG